MEYKNTAKKMLLVIAGIVLVAFLVAFLVSEKFSKPEPVREFPKINTSIQKTEVPSDQAPAKFPANIPIEAGAQITQNYNASTEDGRFQATRVFETNRTLAENLKTYQDFMKADGWEVKSTVNQASYKMVFGIKGNAQLQISIDENSATDKKTVNISYTEKAALE